MMYIDSHTHLNSPLLFEKKEQVIKEMLDAKVNKVIVPGYDLETSKEAIRLAHEYPFIYAAIGFHPTEIKNYGDEEYAWLEANLKDEKVVALGEVGYDFHWDVTTEEEQEISFIRQIELAKKYHKPLIIHCRDAINKTYQTLKLTNAKTIGGIMHSYSGSAEMAPLFIKENFLLGISGTVTFTNAKEPKKVVDEIALEYLVSETDAPYLTPHPYRGSENSPKYVTLVVQKIAEIKDVSVLDVTNQIAININKLFSI